MLPCLPLGTIHCQLIGAESWWLEREFCPPVVMLVCNYPSIFTHGGRGGGGGGLCVGWRFQLCLCPGILVSWYPGVLVSWCPGVLVCWSWRLGKSLENLRVGIRQLCLPLGAQQVAAKCCTALHGGFLCSWLSVLLGNLPAILPSCHPAVPAFLAKGVMFMRWATGRIRVNKLTKIYVIILGEAGKNWQCEKRKLKNMALASYSLLRFVSTLQRSLMSLFQPSRIWVKGSAAAAFFVPFSTVAATPMPNIKLTSRSRSLACWWMSWKLNMRNYKDFALVP